MRLTLHTDYALRVLIYLAVRGSTATIADIAGAFGISNNHLVKIVHELGRLGYIHTVRGKGGGLSLARDPSTVSIAQVVRDLEPNLHLVECFDEKTNTCPIAGVCALQGALTLAQGAFFDTLSRYTLADLVRNRKRLADVLVPAE